MRVAIDGLSYYLNNGELGDYNKQMINTLKINSNDDFSLIKDKEIITNDKLSNGIKMKELYINRINMDYKAINDFINSNRIDIYHCTNNGFSLQSEYKYNCNVVTTIHTVIPELFEGFYHSKYLEKYYYSIQLWDKLTDKIICPSSYLKDELTSKIGINPNKISVILPKVKRNFTTINNYVSRVYLKSKYNFSGDFILYSGELHRRKRLEEFLEIFKSISNRSNNLYFIILCNINNANYNYYTQLNIIIEKMALKDRVIFITSFKKNDKIHFYNATQGVIDFSIYEGLNMSLLEAKSCGANIICSDIKTFRELLGDYPLYLDLNLPFIDELLEDYIMFKNNSVQGDIVDDVGENNLYNLYEELQGNIS